MQENPPRHHVARVLQGNHIKSGGDPRLAQAERGEALVDLSLIHILIGFTYGEWNGRFLVPLWPIIFLWAALGAGELGELLRRERRGL